MKKTSVFYRLMITAVACVTLSFSAAATDYATLGLKASRFYDYKEWASASAMYGLMLEQRPDVASTYARAIISSDMAGEPVSDRMKLLSRSMEARIPLDSIFSAICRDAFDIGQASIYENLLIDLKGYYPWMTRSIDNYLLQYYTFRSDGPKMIEYSLIMLKGMPENTVFLSALAHGYMLTGRDTEAMETYRTILEYSPHDYLSLLNLGNYYYLLAHDEHSDTEAPMLARRYLSEANRLHPTPYVTRLLARLS